MKPFTTRYPARLLCIIASVLLLLGTASVSLSLPTPAAPPMLLARNVAYPVVQPPIGVVDVHRIESVVAIAADFSVTTSEATTVVIPLYGLIPWQISNESGGAATLTFYNALTLEGTALTPYDEDSVAVGTMTIGDDCSQQMPTALSGCTTLVIVGAAAGDHFTLVCKR
jgi:hypothetical protein